MCQKYVKNVTNNNLFRHFRSRRSKLIKKFANIKDS